MVYHPACFGLMKYELFRVVFFEGVGAGEAGFP